MKGGDVYTNLQQKLPENELRFPHKQLETQSMSLQMHCPHLIFNGGMWSM